MLKDYLKAMFADMVLEKNTTLIPKFYHPEFLLFTNGITMDYERFLHDHEKYYATDIQYQIEYDEETFVEANDKLACRVWITTAKPNEGARKIEVILIAQYKENKIYRLWELTYPDWSKMQAFTQP